MAKKKNDGASTTGDLTSTQKAAYVETSEQILDTDVVTELENSFLEYSMSVIVARALPDVRDGLKPVHRRVLFSLFEQGIRPGTPHKKCARVVGDVMGKYHPHGDTSIYEALVRMAQPWSMQLMLVDGHGNFGSPDDGPAAMRYTECRMSDASFSMVEELSEETVAFVPNYDQTENEPEVLPSRVPNLLVNGSTGIAVGMATNMAPHNLSEVVAGLRAMLANPKITLDEMMTHIPGPDFPTGGLIIGAEGVKEALASGRGQFRIRARTHVEDISARRKGIIITELPYGVGPEKIIAKIKELSNLKRLNGVADVKDLTDRKTGLRMVVEVKTGFNPAAVIEDLYRLTPLEETFAANNVTLVDGEPRTLGLLDLCRYYIEHRLLVVKRRSEYRKARAEARAHIVEGLVLALASIDEVVALIKSSKDTDIARQKLMKTFVLSEIQANAILEMTLRRLTSLEVDKLKKELKELHAIIAELKKLLDSPKLMNELVGDELGEVSAAYGVPRRSNLIAAGTILYTPAEPVEDEPCTVTLSTSGLIARSSGPAPTKTGKHQVVSLQLKATVASTVGLLTSTGRLLRIPVADIPATEGRGSGGPAREITDLKPNEQPVALVNVTDKALRITAIGTEQGVLKRVSSANYPQRSGGVLIGLKDDDRIVAAHEYDEAVADTIDLVFVTQSAQLLRTAAKAVRPQGASAGGVAGIKLDAKDRVIAFGTTSGSEPVVVTLSDIGSYKASLLSEYPAKGRGTGGVRCHTFRKNESKLSVAWVGEGPVVGSDETGAPQVLPTEMSKRDASGTVLEIPVTVFGTIRR